MLPRRIFVATTGLGAVLATCSVAWAAAASFSVSPSSGPGGTTVQATGSGFPSAPVEIRWGSHHGTLLETALGPDFSVPVTIPTAAPGIYSLSAAPAGDHASDTEVAAAFEVTGSSAPPGGQVPPAGGAQQLAPLPAQPPFPTSTARQVAVATGARARAVKRCKRRYSARRARTRAKRRRLARKRRTCLSRAKKLPV
jgi:hypothetical protein